MDDLDAFLGDWNDDGSLDRDPEPAEQYLARKLARLYKQELGGVTTRFEAAPGAAIKSGDMVGLNEFGQIVPASQGRVVGITSVPVPNWWGGNVAGTNASEYDPAKFTDLIAQAVLPLATAASTNRSAQNGPTQAQPAPQPLPEPAALGVGPANRAISFED